jgi:hypothetical protein
VWRVPTRSSQLPYVNRHKRVNQSTTLSTDVRDAALRSYIGRAPIDRSEFTDAPDGRSVNAAARRCSGVLLSSFSKHSGLYALQPGTVSSPASDRLTRYVAGRFNRAVACLSRMTRR